MDEVPSAQRPFLFLHDEHARTGEDEEVLLRRLGMEHPRGLAGLEHREGEAGVGEHLRLGVRPLGEYARAALEHAAAAERVVSHPGGLADVDDEPAGGDRREPRTDVLQACFPDHARSFRNPFDRGTCVRVEHTFP